MTPTRTAGKAQGCGMNYMKQMDVCGNISERMLIGRIKNWKYDKQHGSFIRR